MVIRMCYRHRRLSQVYLIHHPSQRQRSLKRSGVHPVGRHLKVNNRDVFIYVSKAGFRKFYTVGCQVSTILQKKQFLDKVLWGHILWGNVLSGQRYPADRGIARENLWEGVQSQPRTPKKIKMKTVGSTRFLLYTKS